MDKACCFLLKIDDSDTFGVLIVDEFESVTGDHISRVTILIHLFAFPIANAVVARVQDFLREVFRVEITREKIVETILENIIFIISQKDEISDGVKA